jgi:hypothetical protein
MFIWDFLVALVHRWGVAEYTKQGWGEEVVKANICWSINVRER